MKSSELKNKDQKSLIDMLAQKREAVRNFRFGTAGSKTRNVREGRTFKREIAQILTAMNANTKANTAK